MQNAALTELRRSFRKATLPLRRDTERALADTSPTGQTFLAGRMKEAYRHIIMEPEDKGRQKENRSLSTPAPVPAKP